MDQDIRIIQIDLHALGVGHEVRREISLIELHPLDHVQSCLDAFRLLHRDGPILTDLVHGLSDDITDFTVPVGRHGGDLGDLVAVGNLLRNFGQTTHDSLRSLHDPPLQADGISSGSHVAQTFLVDGLGKHGCGSGSVSGHIGGLTRDLTDELGSHVFVRIFEIDLLGHRNTVFGDSWGPEFLVEDHVPSSWSESGFHRSGQFLYPAQERVAGRFVKL